MKNLLPTLSIISSLVFLSILIPKSQSVTLSNGYPLYLFNCSKDGNFSSNSQFQYNLYNLLSNLSSQASLTGGFYYNSMGQSGPSQVYASYLCRGDVPLQMCSKCVSNATQTVVSTCPYQKSGAIWYVECMFQYSDMPYWGVVQDRFKLLLWNSTRNMSGGEVARFGAELDEMLGEVVKAAANAKNMFATKEGRLSINGSGDGWMMYSLAQCRLDLSSGDCERCLKECIGNVSEGKIGGMVIFPSCNIRFEDYLFYLQGTSGTQDGRKSTSTITLIVILISVAFAAFLCFGIGLYLCHRKIVKTHYAAGDLQEITTAESLQFDFNKIRASTNNFSSDRKLGQGGFGPVYKGRLENGQEIAVKRLSKGSGQGIREFKNEVLLVAKLQHRNLVKLIGFCISGEEIALVYEFLPNSSLDKFFSDPSKKKCLYWPTRFKIICGIAKGLLYLHDDSRLKIIHRDLKSSNILLDEVMNPKISDFGLARLFGVDQTQDDTKQIVGTYGYMAPEYALTGHFSTKSDVYSFGVIVLELVSGQKSRFFNRPEVEEALLLRAWKLWSEGRGLELVDSSLEDHYSSEEVSKCVDIGLLCVQEDPVQRPNMSSVVASLSGQYDVTLPSPVAPIFCTSLATLTSTSGSSDTPYVQRKLLGDGKDSFSGERDITYVTPR